MNNNGVQIKPKKRKARSRKKKDIPIWDGKINFKLPKKFGKWVKW